MLEWAEFQGILGRTFPGQPPIRQNYVFWVTPFHCVTMGPYFKGPSLLLGSLFIFQGPHFQCLGVTSLREYQSNLHGLYMAMRKNFF